MYMILRRDKGKRAVSIFSEKRSFHHDTANNRVDSLLRWVPTPPSTPATLRMAWQYVDRSVMARAPFVRGSLVMWRRYISDLRACG